MIVLIGSEKEWHIGYLRSLLANKGMDPFLLDTEDFPQAWTLSLHDDQIKVDGRPLPTPKVVYLRQLYLSPAMSSPTVATWMDENWYAALMAFAQKSAILTSLIRTWESQGACFINSFTGSQAHGTKPFQLHALRAAGLPVPPTLVTNSPAEVKAFVRTYGKVIYKPLAGGAHTKQVEARDLADERLELLSNAPAIFQVYVPGTNLRVYVLGDQVISSGVIDSDHIDFREGDQKVQEISVPEDIATACVQAAQACGLTFTAIDLRWEENGPFTFLECNWSPMFLGWDRQVERKVGPTLAEFIGQRA